MAYLKTPLDAFTHYERGMYTKREVVCLVLKHLTDDNSADFFDFCSPEYIEWLKEAVARYPANDDESEWSKMVSINGGLARTTRPFGVGPDRSAEQIKAEEDAEKALVRRGIRACRKEIARRLI